MPSARARAPGRREQVTDLFAPVAADLLRVESAIEAAIQTDDQLVAEVCTHLLRGGGKRIRPALALLSAQVFTDDVSAVVPLAAAIEMIHMATLVHDDVVDNSSTRRGLPTVNARWNNGVSVLAGDYLFAKAFSMLAESGNPRIVQVMADVVFAMSNGELQQLVGAGDPDQSVESYLDRISKKTAVFIAESCRVGALAVQAPPEAVEALYEFGLALGMGFQVIDDRLDFTATSWELGKPAAADVRGGILTYPVLYALRHAPGRQELLELLRQGPVTEEDLPLVMREIEACGALDAAAVLAGNYVDEARQQLKGLPSGAAADALQTVTGFVVERQF